MANTSKHKKIPERDIAYYRKRYQNRVFSEIAAAFAAEAERSGLTKRDIADQLGRDPAAITRWLTAPANLTLETVSDIFLALSGEADTNFVRFADRVPQNYAHPLVDKILARDQQKAPPPFKKVTVAAHKAMSPGATAGNAASGTSSSQISVVTRTNA